MNENLDLTKILKNCPQGTKLFSNINGYVEFVCILRGEDEGEGVYPILVKQGDSNYNYTKDGYYYDETFRDKYAEPSLYPAHDQRDWSKFEVPNKKVKVTLHPFDRVLGKMGNTSVWHTDFIDTKVDNHIDFISKIEWDEFVPYNKDTAHLLGTNEECPIDYEIEFSKEFKE